MKQQLLSINPKKRRKTRAKKTSGRRRIRRNPIRLTAGSIMATAKAGAVGAAGAIAVDFAMQRLPIPPTLLTSNLLPAVRGLVGVGLGYIVSRFLKQRRLGEELATGAVAVSLYGVGKNLMSGGMVPPEAGVSGFNEGLLGLGYFNPGGSQQVNWEENEYAGMGYQPSPNSGGDFF